MSMGLKILPELQQGGISVYEQRSTLGKERSVGCLRGVKEASTGHMRVSLHSGDENPA